MTNKIRPIEAATYMAVTVFVASSVILALFAFFAGVPLVRYLKIEGVLLVICLIGFAWDYFVESTT